MVGNGLSTGGAKEHAHHPLLWLTSCAPLRRAEHPTKTGVDMGTGVFAVRLGQGTYVQGRNKVLRASCPNWTRRQFLTWNGESSHAAVAPMTAVHQQPPPCIELHHLNMKHSKWLLNRGTTVPIKRATFAQHSLQQILLMVTNIPMSCWRLPGSEYYISTRHLTLVQGIRVSPFRWALLKISCGKFAWAFWCLGRALITNCLQGKKYRESWHSCTGITPPCTLSHPPAISLADFNDNNCHAHVWTVTPITQQLIPELRRVAHSDSHRENFPVRITDFLA